MLVQVGANNVSIKAVLSKDCTSKANTATKFAKRKGLSVANAKGFYFVVCAPSLVDNL